MSKTIRLDDIVYLHLEVFRGKRETFSQVVERLLQVIARLEDVTPLIYPGETSTTPSAAEIQKRYSQDITGKLIQKVGEVQDDNRRL